MRHLGNTIATGQRCCIVMMQIPDRPDHALICNIDSLPRHLDSAVKETINSPAAQSEEMLAKVLSERRMSNSTKSIMQTLHDSRLLKAEPIANIMMTPSNTMSIPLTDVLKAMGKSLTVPAVVGAENSTIVPMVDLVNQPQISGNTDFKQMADNLIAEAIDLEMIAQRKRNLAATYNPDLALPVKTSPVAAVTVKKSSGRPKKTVAAKASEG